MAIIIEIIVLLYYVMLLIPKQPDITLYPQDFERRYVEDLELYDDGGLGVTRAGSPKESIFGHRISHMEPGRYHVIINYSSEYGTEHSHGDFAGEVLFTKHNSNSGVLSNEIKLRDDGTVSQDHIWLKSGFVYNDVDVDVIYHGDGLLSVNSITISENYIYRLMRVMAVLLLITAVNAFICYMTGELFEASAEQKAICVGLVAVVVFSSALVWAGKLFYGHDMQFHVNRIALLAEAIRDRQIPHRIQYSWNNGYGYISPLFYGELFLTFPAVLYILGCPLYVAYNSYLVATNIAMCLVAYYCIKKMFGSRKYGLLGAFLYTCSAYHMTNIYNRTSLGEYTAQIFLPLLIYGFYKIYTKADDEKFTFKDVLPIVVAFSGIIECHTLTTMMAAEYSVLLALIFWKKTFRKGRLLTLLKGAGATVLINAWFLVPFVDAMRKMDLRIEHYNYQISGEAATWPQILGVFHPSQGATALDSAYDEMPMAIGFALVIAMLLVIPCLIKKNDWKAGCEREYTVLNTTFWFGVIALVMSSNIFPWDLVERIPVLGSALSKVQFPWRYLTIATVMAVFAGLMALYLIAAHTERRNYAVALAGVMVLMTLISEGGYVSDLLHDVEAENTISDHTISYTSDLLYLPDTALNTQVYYQRLISCYGTSQILGVDENRGIKSYTVANTSEVEDVVELPIFMYEGYRARDIATGQTFEIYAGSNKYMAVKIPGNYNGTFEVKFVEPVLWRISEALSVLTLLTLIVLGILKRKNEGNRQSGLS